MKLSLLLFFSMLSFFAAAQSPAARMEVRTISDHWTVDPSKFVDDLSVQLKREEAPLPGGDLRREELRAFKMHMQEQYPRNNAGSSQRGGERSTDTAQVMRSFPSSFFLNQAPMQGGTPNDNTMAISDDGKLIASWNSQLWAYDVEADTYLFELPAIHPSFFQFLSSYNDTVYQLSFPFDPKLQYDPNRDRFILTFLTGREPANSAAIVCFSSSNDPKDLWHAYRLPGDPLNYETWTDYPQVALNENSYYLTLNQLYPDSGWVEGFAETVLWQIDLDEAFSGASAVTTKLWTGFQYEGKNIRYLHPVKTHLGPESDTMYMIANRPFVETNDTFFLVRVVGDAANPDTNISVSLLPSSLPYGHPPYAYQSGGQRFWTNDARILGAVRMENTIHFTGNTIDTNSGKATIYHGVIADVDNPEVSGSIITDPQKELGFPNIDFIGVTRTDRDVLLFANHTGTDMPAGNSMIYVNHNGSYGPVQTIVRGETYVNALQTVEERWGDYTGIQRKYNETAKVWVAGYWGFGNASPGTYISEISGPKDGPLSTEETPSDAHGVIFPNPATQWASIAFAIDGNTRGTFELRDVHGRYLRALGAAQLASGQHSLSFDVSSLSSGIYFVSLRTAEGVLWTEKLVVR